MTPRRKKVNPGDIAGVLCGWPGCRASGAFSADGLLPAGWGALVLSKHSLLDLARVRRPDMVVCPKHIQALKRRLKALSSK